MSSWECHRCGQVNAPHVNQCSCEKPVEEEKEPSYPSEKEIVMWGGLGLFIILFLGGLILLADQAIPDKKTVYRDREVPVEVSAPTPIKTIGVEKNTGDLDHFEREELKDRLGIPWYDDLPEKYHELVNIYEDENR